MSVRFINEESVKPEEIYLGLQFLEVSDDHYKTAENLHDAVLVRPQRIFLQCLH